MTWKTSVRPRGGLGTLALCGALASCGSGGGGGEVGGGDPAASFAQKGEFSADDVDQLLLRSQFGLSAEARASIASDGVPAFVDAMLDFPVDGSTQVEQDADLLLVRQDDPPGLEGQFPSGDQIAERWLHLMMHTKHPFQERLALFWHDHFAVSSSVLNAGERRWMVTYVDRLRNHGLGNFRDLVLEMARDSAMLEWLDGTSSVKGEPNENFAREFFELFTVGADNGYTELDIQEASRAFTGYRNRLDAQTNLRHTEFDAERKDIFAKVLFDDVVVRSNGEAEDDYALVVDATFEHLRVDRWLAEKLLLEFVSDAPSAAQVNNLASLIRAHDYEMRPILRSLFLSNAFYSGHKTMVKSPIDYAVGFVRATGLTVEPSVLRRELEALAQVPSMPPSVFGWPQGPQWLSAEGMVERANLVREVILQRDFHTQEGITLGLPAGDPDAGMVVDHYASLLDVSLVDAERELLVDYLDHDVRWDDSLVVDPFDHENADHLSIRVRGLLYILANHEDAMLR